MSQSLSSVPIVDSYVLDFATDEAHADDYWYTGRLLGYPIGKLLLLLVN